MNAALAWALVVMGCAGWVLFAVAMTGHVVRWLRRTAKTPVPGQTLARAAHPPPPGPAPNKAEADVLNGIQRARVTANPAAVENSRLIADGLRIRLPHVDDATLGLVVFDLSGYIHAAVLSGAPWAVHALGDALSLSAEELTRMARQEVPR